MSKVYSIGTIDNEGQKLKAIISIDPAHEVFEGHFPEKSVLPGVIELEIIKKVISQFSKCQFRLKSIKNAKYLAMILPDEVQQFVVDIDFVEHENDLKVKALVKNDYSIFLKFSGEFVRNE